VIPRLRDALGDDLLDRSDRQPPCRERLDRCQPAIPVGQAILALTGLPDQLAKAPAARSFAS
jgi:hypothetical protein